MTLTSAFTTGQSQWENIGKKSNIRVISNCILVFSVGAVACHPSPFHHVFERVSFSKEQFSTHLRSAPPHRWAPRTHRSSSSPLCRSLWRPHPAQTPASANNKNIRRRSDGTVRLRCIRPVQIHALLSFSKRVWRMEFKLCYFDIILNVKARCRIFFLY